MTASLVGVGVGPGDPELLTTRALRVLRGADRVFGPTFALDAVGRAESIVRQADPDIAVERLVIDLRSPSYDRAASQVCACLDRGEQVACITLGDPSVYSTFPSIAEAVVARRPETPVATVPGIMAFQELAARAGMTVLDRSERLALISAVDGADAVDAALADPGSALVVYKGARHIPAIVERLVAADRLEGAVMGELLGLPGERVGPVKDLARGPAAYLATLIVPPRQRR